MTSSCCHKQKKESTTVIIPIGIGNCKGHRMIFAMWLKMIKGTAYVSVNFDRVCSVEKKINTMDVWQLISIPFNVSTSEKIIRIKISGNVPNFDFSDMAVLKGRKHAK